MFTITSYNQFFRTAAIWHVDIEHNVTAEGQDGPVAECGFYIGIDKAINGIRTQTRPDKCTLIVLKYEAKGTDNGAFDYRGLYTGGFIICKAADISNSAEVEAVEAITEETAWDIINLIIQKMVNPIDGLHCLSPFGEVSMNDVRMTHVGPFVDKQFGWLVEFDFLIEKNTLINPERVVEKFFVPPAFP